MQYNCGYPAVLKNALDYLYHEWRGKSAGIISYGGQGGGQGAAQLAEVTSPTLFRLVAVCHACKNPQNMHTSAAF